MAARPRWLPFRVALLVVLLMAWSATASGQTSEERELAVRLGREGVELYNEQRFEDAFDRFANAEALVHSPVFVLYLARIDRKRGRWTTALARYDAVIAEEMPDDAADAWKKAREEARLERKRLAQRIPTFVVDVGNAPAEEVVVALDGKVVDWRSGAVLANPGRHEVAARLGQRTRRTTVELHEGDRDIAVRFVFDVPKPEPAPGGLGPVPPPPPMPPPFTPDVGPNGQQIASYVLLALAGATGLSALGTGIGAAVKDSALADVCLEDVCPGFYRDDVSQLDDLNRATLGLSIASASFLVAGWIVSATAPSNTAPPVGFFVGPQGAGAVGRLTW